MNRTDYNDYLAQDEDRIARRRAARAHGRRHRRLRATVALVALLMLVSVGFVAAGVGTGRRAAASSPPAELVTAAILDADDASALARAQDTTPVVAESQPASEPAPEPAPTAAKPVAAPSPKPAAKTRASASQRLTVKIGDYGYEPSQLTASSASPIVLTVGKGEGCAAGFVLPQLNIELDNSGGSVTKNLGRLKPGTYRFNCAMGMVEGLLVVK